MAPPSYKEAWEIQSCHVPGRQEAPHIWWSAIMTNTIINKQINKWSRQKHPRVEYKNEVSDKVCWNCVFACVCVMCIFFFFFTKWLIIHSRKILSFAYNMLSAIIGPRDMLKNKTRKNYPTLLCYWRYSSEGYMAHTLIDQSLFTKKVDATDNIQNFTWIFPPHVHYPSE